METLKKRKKNTRQAEKAMGKRSFREARPSPFFPGTMDEHHFRRGLRSTPNYPSLISLYQNKDHPPPPRRRCCYRRRQRRRHRLSKPICSFIPEVPYRTKLGQTNRLFYIESHPRPRRVPAASFHENLNFGDEFIIIALYLGADYL